MIILFSSAFQLLKIPIVMPYIFNTLFEEMLFHLIHKTSLHLFTLHNPRFLPKSKRKMENLSLYLLASSFRLEMKGFLISDSWRDMIKAAFHTMWQILWLVMSSGELVNAAYILNAGIIIGSQRITHFSLTAGKDRT